MFLYMSSPSLSLSKRSREEGLGRRSGAVEVLEQRLGHARLRQLCLANSNYLCKLPSFHRLVNPGGNGTIGAYA